MKLIYRSEIIGFSAFREVWHTLRSTDPGMARSMKYSLHMAVKPYHETIAREDATPDQCLAALLQEQMTVSSHANKYLSMSEELNRKKSALLSFAVEAPELFFDSLFDQLEEYFRSKKECMCCELEQSWEWYSGIVDAARKGGGAAMKKVASFTQSMTDQKLFDEQSLFDDRTMVERLLEKYLSPSQVGRDITRMMDQAGHVYKEAWKKQIMKHVPDLGRISGYSFADQARRQMDGIEFQFGNAEQSMIVGMTSAILATIWLAAGWHTLAYAFANIFPPIALFTAVFTVAAGVVTRDQVVRSRKKQIEDTVNMYFRYFLTQLDNQPIAELGGISLRRYVGQTGQSIVNAAVREWEKNIFGGLTAEHFHLLNSAFQRHLLYLEESVHEIKQLQRKGEKTNGLPDTNSRLDGRVGTDLPQSEGFRAYFRAKPQTER
jgi:hypothetical protein